MTKNTKRYRRSIHHKSPTRKNKKNPRKHLPPHTHHHRHHHHPDHIYIYFVHVPKTAGSAIKELLRRNDTRPQPSHKPREGWLLHTKTGMPVHIIARGHSEASSFPPRARNVFKLATIREPVERFISAYNFVREGGKNHPNQGAVQQARDWAPFLQKYKTIDAFLKDAPAVQTIMDTRHGHTHFDHLSRWLNTSHGHSDIDVYIRQTDVANDVRTFCNMFHLHLTDRTIHNFNVTGEKSKRTPYTCRKIKELLHDDIQLYQNIIDTITNTHRRTERKVHKLFK